MALTSSLRPGSIVRGPTLPEPVEVLAIVPLGDSLKIIGRGLNHFEILETLADPGSPLGRAALNMLQ